MNYEIYTLINQLLSDSDDIECLFSIHCIIADDSKSLDRSAETTTIEWIVKTIYLFDLMGSNNFTILIVRWDMKEAASQSQLNIKN
jgi:hypothetical protein